MNKADAINGLYELIGGLCLLQNCFRLYKDKQVKGVTLHAAAFFATWSWWNLWYYPSLNQWLSFSGAILIAVTNAIWVVMAIYYTKRK
jgi:hypothetical protein